MTFTSQTGPALAAAITRAASSQTHTTIRYLVDRGRVDDAYRAYAYFRWVDDTLDEGTWGPSERLGFVDRQTDLANRCFRGETPAFALADEERLLVDLVRADRSEKGGLSAYIRNMMAVMAFDAGRRGRLVSRDELAAYSHWLAVAVTECMHYFIGHDDPTPRGDSRYLAVTAAHVTHMLRDTLDDVRAGYFNIPREFLEAHGIGPADVGSEAYRLWVRQRVELARSQFAAGRAYLAQVANRRCRIAGCAYVARFEGVLDAIQRDDFRLRAVYPEGKGPACVARTTWSALAAVFSPLPQNAPARSLADQIPGER